MLGGMVVRFVSDSASLLASDEAIVTASDEGEADFVWGCCGGREDGGDQVGRD